MILNDIICVIKNSSYIRGMLMRMAIIICMGSFTITVAIRYQEHLACKAVLQMYVVGNMLRLPTRLPTNTETYTLPETDRCGDNYKLKKITIGR